MVVQFGFLFCELVLIGQSDEKLKLLQVVHGCFILPDAGWMLFHLSIGGFLCKTAV